MMSLDLMESFAKKQQTSVTTIAREYLQYVILSAVSESSQSKNFFFKGGTAIHLIYGSERFSEDIDFSTTLSLDEARLAVEAIFSQVSLEESIAYKQKKSVAGLCYLVTGKFAQVSYPIYVKVDVSIREMPLLPTHSFVTTEYPVIFREEICHLDAREMYAEKIRAISTRSKGRDIYDLWFLAQKGYEATPVMMQQKLDYYGETLDLDGVLLRIKGFNESQFVSDLRPFVWIKERNRLPELLKYIGGYFEEKWK